MNYIITENQKSILDDYNFVKKIFFKYWDKLGPEINKDVISRLFASDPYGKIRVGNSIITMSEIQNMLKEWYGIDKAIETAKEILLNKTHRIGDEFPCGTYVFDFKVTNLINRTKSIDWESDISVNVAIDSENGEVTIAGDDETYSLADAWDNEDYGWEVDDEIQSCISDYFHKYITEKTGVRIDINTILDKYDD